MDFCCVLNQKSGSEIINLFKCKLIYNNSLQMSLYIKGPYSFIATEDMDIRKHFNNDVEEAQIYHERSIRLM